MGAERRVRLFRNGRSQALRIPSAMRFESEEVVVHQDDQGRLIVEPVPAKRLLETLASWDELDETFPDVDAGLPAAEDPPF